MTTLHPLPSQPLAARTAVARLRESSGPRELVTYTAVGILFGVVLVKSEVVSWYRIQEMFRFQSFHMYGILGSAMLTALFPCRFCSAARCTRFRASESQFHQKPSAEAIGIGSVACCSALVGR